MSRQSLVTENDEVSDDDDRRDSESDDSTDDSENEYFGVSRGVINQSQPRPNREVSSVRRDEGLRQDVVHTRSLQSTFRQNTKPRPLIVINPIAPPEDVREIDESLELLELSDHDLDDHEEDVDTLPGVTESYVQKAVREFSHLPRDEQQRIVESVLAQDSNENLARFL